MAEFGRRAPLQVTGSALITLLITATMVLPGSAYAGLVSNSNGGDDHAQPQVAAPIDDELPSSVVSVRLPSIEPPFAGDAVPMPLPPVEAPVTLPAAPALFDAEPALTRVEPAGRRGDGEPLRQVLRSLTTVYGAAPRAAGETIAARARVYDDADEGALSLVDVSDLILESEIAGRAVRELVDVKSTDGVSTTFSVLGIGDFMVETRSGAHAATVTELSTGQSLTFAAGGGSVGRTGDVDRTGGADPDERPRTKDGLLQVIHWVLDFLQSPLGVLLIMTVSVVAFLWAGVRSLAALQRRAMMARQSYRGRDIHPPLVKPDRR